MGIYLPLLAQGLAIGLLTGILYVLVALGLTLIYGILHIVNFAHGEIYMLGAMAVFYFHVVGGLPLAPTLLVIVVLSLLFGLAIERGVFRSLRGQWLQLVVASVGISLVIQSVGWIVFGIQEKTVPTYVSGIVQFLGVRLPRERLLAAGVAVVLVAGLYVLVYRTKVGLAMRAIEEDEETARMLGVNANRVAALSVALGFVLAAVAGAFVAPIYSLNPGMGLEPILMSFLIIIVGGLGSITGTVLAGLLVGVLQSVGGVLFGAEAAYGLVFAVMIAVLVVRPAGLLGAGMSVKAAALAVLLVALVALPPLAEPYVLHVAIVVLINAVYAEALYVIMRMGYLSFGHAGYIALGAYTSALLATKLGVSPWLGILAGALVAAGFAWLLGLVTLKLRGIYFSLSVFAFAEVVNAVFRAVDAFGGPAGIANVPRPSIWGVRLNGHLGFYYVVLAAAVVSLLFLYRLAATRFGFTLLALRTRDTEALAESVGIASARHKTLAFVASCFFCGLMGAVHCHYLRFVSPFVFTFFLSTDLVIFNMVGGLGSFWGPLAGSVLLTALGEQLFAAGYYKSLVYALVLLVVILALPGGLIQLPRAREAWAARRLRLAKAPVTAAER